MKYFWIVPLFSLYLLLDFTDASPPINQNCTVVTQKPGELSKNKCLEYYPAPDNPILSVAGGNKSLAKEFPHMAIIGYGENNIEWKCGGSLISKKFILTAAHCLNDGKDGPKYVRLGDLDLSTEEDDAIPQDFTIIRSIPHPSYQPPHKYHDIALLELDHEANFSSYVSPACLHLDKELNQDILTATGWGKTGYTDSASSFLLKVDLDHVPHEECLTVFGKISERDLPHGINEDSQICAGKVRGQDTCSGDSGGPLQVANKERTFYVSVYNIIGVTSFGKACALSAAPGIYTRVSNYIPWIETIAWEYEKDN